MLTTRATPTGGVVEDSEQQQSNLVGLKKDSLVRKQAEKSTKTTGEKKAQE